MRIACSPIVLCVLLATPTAAQTPSGLSRLVDELERHNPELQAARREVDMQVARIAPAGTPPDPTFSVGYMGGLLRPPFFPSSATPNGFRQFAISQEFLYPGKLSARARVEAIEADARRWSYEDVRVRLIGELKSAYADYVYVDRSRTIVARSKELLEQFRRIAEARFSVGKAAQQDVLKAQVEISLLIERLALLDRDRTALQARINALLYRAPDTAVPSDLSVATASLSFTLDELRRLTAERAPAVKRDESRVDRGQHVLTLAHREVLPDFAVNLTTEQAVAGMPWMYGVDFTVKLPVFWNRRQRPLIAEARAGLESARKTRDNTLAMAEARVVEEHAAVTTAERLVALYQDSILPQARLAHESSRAAYEVGSVDFLTVLMNFMTVLDYEINLEEQRARRLQGLARLEPITGLDLVK
ncbi:MAG: TolC family protein [Acidobacteria bacterium]|nr:TolC family protein [Acidobacteriota bacterium]